MCSRELYIFIYFNSKTKVHLIAHVFLNLMAW